MTAFYPKGIPCVAGCYYVSPGGTWRNNLPTHQILSTAEIILQSLEKNGNWQRFGHDCKYENQLIPMASVGTGTCVIPHRLHSYLHIWCHLCFFHLAERAFQTVSSRAKKWEIKRTDTWFAADGNFQFSPLKKKKYQQGSREALFLFHRAFAAGSDWNWQGPFLTWVVELKIFFSSRRNQSSQRGAMFGIGIEYKLNLN